MLARIDRQSKFTFIQYFTSPGEVLEENQTMFGVKQAKKSETLQFFETSLPSYQLARHTVPEGLIHHQLRCENLH
jgi:hypothetical protein